MAQFSSGGRKVYPALIISGLLGAGLQIIPVEGIPPPPPAGHEL